MNNSAVEVKENHTLGGRVRLLQPAAGYRAAIDAVLLAAAVPAVEGESVLEAGSGVGTAALCLAARVPGVRVTGIEIQTDLVDLAVRNVGLNGVAERVSFAAGDIADGPPGEPFDHVMANPPHQRADNARPSPDPVKRLANMESGIGLADWVRFAARALKPRGTLTLIHRADRLDEIIACLGPAFGELVVFPLWPGGDEPGRPAKRVLVRARKDARTPLRLCPGLVLHEPGGAYTPAADAVLSGAQALAL